MGEDTEADVPFPKGIFSFQNLKCSNYFVVMCNTYLQK